MNNNTLKSIIYLIPVGQILDVLTTLAAFTFFPTRTWEGNDLMVGVVSNPALLIAVKVGFGILAAWFLFNAFVKSGRWEKKWFVHARSTIFIALAAASLYPIFNNTFFLIYLTLKWGFPL